MSVEYGVKYSRPKNFGTLITDDRISTPWFLGDKIVDFLILWGALFLLVMVTGAK